MHQRTFGLLPPRGYLNSAAVKMGMQTFFFFFWSSWFEFFEVICSEVGLLDHTIVLFWIWGKPHVVFHSFHCFSSPPAAQKAYGFSGLLLWKKRRPWLAGAICRRCSKRSHTRGVWSSWPMGLSPPPLQQETPPAASSTAKASSILNLMQTHGNGNIINYEFGTSDCPTDRH